jgi:DNA-binding HxlR family transcriptional regulator
MSIPKNKKLTEEVNDAIKMIGDAHILCIVASLSDHGMRFNELQRAINDINPTTLADRLKKLELEKIVDRKEETLDKLSVVYELTEKGRSILPIIKEIGKFADKFLKE